MHNAITDVAGIRVGHYTDKQGITGCTVILCEQGAVAGVDVSGSAPGTRETELLHPGHSVEKVHAILLSGGSAFGLDAAGGVMKYLEGRGVGHETSAGVVPIVPAAILYDINIGSQEVRPGFEEGYQACVAASSGGVAEGCVGAGTGATVGKFLGMKRATKGGLGTASRKLAKGVVVAALIVVNAFGDVLEPNTGRIIAGTRHPRRKCFLSTSQLFQGDQFKRAVMFSACNTTIGVVATNARLDKEQANRLAKMAQVGIARTIDPCTSSYDGDVLFALSLGERGLHSDALGSAAAEVVATAVTRGVLEADSMGGVPAARDLAW
jgi:L-aminopeptidase/D-esterase-like protein